MNHNLTESLALKVHSFRLTCETNKVVELWMKLDMFKYPNSELNYEVDAYVVSVHPEQSQNRLLYLSDRAYWFSTFDKTRRNRRGNRMSKGFLEVVY